MQFEGWDVRSKFCHQFAHEIVTQSMYIDISDPVEGSSLETGGEDVKRAVHVYTYVCIEGTYAYKCCVLYTGNTYNVYNIQCMRGNRVKKKYYINVVSECTHMIDSTHLQITSFPPLFLTIRGTSQAGLTRRLDPSTIQRSA